MRGTRPCLGRYLCGQVFCKQLNFRRRHCVFISALSLYSFHAGSEAGVPPFFLVTCWTTCARAEWIGWYGVDGRMYAIYTAWTRLKTFIYDI